MEKGTRYRHVNFEMSVGHLGGDDKEIGGWIYELKI